MHKCILCTNSTSKTSKSEITYHSFPRNLQRRKKWLDSLKIENCFEWHRICSKHFDQNKDFRPGEKRLLWPHAVPKRPDRDDEDDEDETESNELQNENPTPSNIVAPRRSTRKMKCTQKFITLAEELRSRDNRLKKKPSTGPRITDVQNQVPEPKLQIDTTNQTNQRKPVVVYGIRCSVKNCENRYTNKISFFGYPQDISARKLWVHNCGLEGSVDPYEKPKSSLRVCGHHFEDRMFINGFKKNRLKPDAVPTIFFENDGNGNSLPTTSNYESDTMTEDMCNSNGGDDDSSSINRQENYHSTIIILEQSGRFKKDNVFVANKNQTYKCSVTGCSGPENFEPIISLFTPPSACIDEWCSLLDQPLTRESFLCPKHFEAQDLVVKRMNIPNRGKFVVTTLIAGAMPIPVKKNKGLLRRPIIDYDDDSLLLKKPRIHSADVSEITTKSANLPEDGDGVYINSSNPSTAILKSTLQLNSTSHVSQLSLKHDEHILTIESTEVPKTSVLKPSTSNGDSMIDSSQSNLKDVLPKILANTSLSVSIQSNVNQNKLVSAVDSTKVVSSTDISKPILKLNTISAGILSSSSSTILSQSSLEQIQKTFANKSSVSLEPIIRQSEPVPTANSTETTDPTDVSKPIVVSEPPVDILSADDSITNSLQSSLEQIQKTFANNSVSISLQPNVNQSKQVLATDSTEVVRSDNILKQSEIKIEPIDDDLPTISTYDSTNEFSLANNSEQNINQSNPVPPIDAVDSSMTLVPTLHIKDEPVEFDDDNDTEILDDSELPDDTIPSNSNGASNTSKTLANNSVSFTRQPSFNHNFPTTAANSSTSYTSKSSFEPSSKWESAATSGSLPFTRNPSFNHNLPTTRANNSMTYTLKSSFEPSNEQELVTTSKVSNQLSANPVICPEFINNQISFFKSISPSHVPSTPKSPSTPVISNCISLNSKTQNLTSNRNSVFSKNKDIVYNNVSFIHDIHNEVVLPNIFWKILSNLNKSLTIFVQRDEFMNTVKRIKFQTSLVPEILINGKHFEYKKPIRTKTELEKLLEKINNIQICSGYDGYVYEKCMGYFEEPATEGNESCPICRNLVKEEHLSKVNTIIKHKSNTLNQLSNKVSELTARVHKARSRMQQKKRQEHIKNVLKTMGPIEILSALRPL